MDAYFFTLSWPANSFLVNNLNLNVALFFVFADHMLPSKHEEDINVFQKKTSGVINYTTRILSVLFLFFIFK